MDPFGEDGAVSWNGAAIRLAPLQRRILAAIVASRIHVTTYELSDALGVSRGSIASRILAMRRAFRQADPSFDRLETNYNLGYRWRP